jgi:hypothetical protein
MYDEDVDALLQLPHMLDIGNKCLMLVIYTGKILEENF